MELCSSICSDETGEFIPGPASASAPVAVSECKPGTVADGAVAVAIVECAGATSGGWACAAAATKASIAGTVYTRIRFMQLYRK